MLKLKIIDIQNDIIEVILYINCDEKLLYHIIFSITDGIHILDSGIPEEYKMYESHARVALKRYEREDLCIGKEIVSAWY